MLCHAGHRRIVMNARVVDDDLKCALLEYTLERYARFREDPARAVWHAVRRALVSHLMIRPQTQRAKAHQAMLAGRLESLLRTAQKNHPID